MKTKQSAVICLFDINNRLNLQDNGSKICKMVNTNMTHFLLLSVSFSAAVQVYI